MAGSRADAYRDAPAPRVEEVFRADEPGPRADVAYREDEPGPRADEPLEMPSMNLERTFMNWRFGRLADELYTFSPRTYS